MPDKSLLKLQPATGALGATVLDIDLSAPLSAGLAAALYDAWLNYQVLFFEDQSLDIEQFKTFVRRFGELEHHAFIGKVKGDTDVELLTGKVDTRWTPSTSVFHIDVSMQPVPTKGAALYAVDVPPVGGDTIWVNAYAAWDALSASMQAFIANHRGLFVATHRRALDAMIRGGPETAEIAKGFLQTPSEHPLVHTHPETGRKALFVDTLFMWSVVDLKPAESDALCGFLFQHIIRPEFQCRLHWRAGTLAIWDNRCTLHSRVDDLPGGASRIMHRLPLKGETAPVLG